MYNAKLDGYGPPDGFCFECDDPPIQDDPRIFNVNVKERADKFVAEMKKRSISFRTPNILIPFGSDFQYQNANVNFKVSLAQSTLADSYTNVPHVLEYG